MTEAVVIGDVAYDHQGGGMTWDPRAQLAGTSSPKRVAKATTHSKQTPKPTPIPSNLDNVVAKYHEEKAAMRMLGAIERDGLTTDIELAHDEINNLARKLEVHIDEVEKLQKDLLETAKPINTQITVHLEIIDTVTTLQAELAMVRKSSSNEDTKIAKPEDEIVKSHEGYRTQITELRKSHDELEARVERLNYSILEANGKATTVGDRFDPIPGEMQFLRAQHVTDPSSLAYDNPTLLRQCSIITQSQRKSPTIGVALLSDIFCHQFPIAQGCPHIIPSPIFITAEIDTELRAELSAAKGAVCSTRGWKPFQWMDGEELMAAHSWTFFELYNASVDPSGYSKDQVKRLQTLYRHYVASIIANKEIVQEYAANILVTDDTNTDADVGVHV